MWLGAAILALIIGGISVVVGLSFGLSFLWLLGIFAFSEWLAFVLAMVLAFVLELPITRGGCNDETL
jgi:hypothetical protein